MSLLSAPTSEIDYPGSGFSLRQWEENDASTLVKISHDKDIRQFTSVPVFEADKQAKQWIAERIHETTIGLSLYLGIVPDDQTMPVGSVNVLKVDELNQKAELGYWLQKSARGKGWASEALRELATWCVRSAGLIRVELFISCDNNASQRVAERAGFTFEGLLRSYRLYESRRLDLMVFSLIDSDV